MQSHISKSGRLALLGAFLSSVAFGCVITVGDGGKTASECPDKNSYLSNDKCFCEFGYDWCNANDDADLHVARHQRESAEHSGQCGGSQSTGAEPGLRRHGLGSLLHR